MKKLIPFRLAGNLLLIAFALLVIFHLLIMAGIVPSDIVWGGNVDASNFWLLETIALAVSILFMAIIAARMGYIRAGRFTRVVKVGVWLVFAYMVLNTVGNLAASSTFETLVFTPLTVVLALCALRLALEP